MPIILSLAIAFTVFCCVALLLTQLMLKPSAEAQRVLEVVTSARMDRRVLGLRERLENTVAAIARGFRARFNLAANSKMELRLQAAGLRSTLAPDLFFAARFLTPIIGVFVGSFIPGDTLFYACILAGVGYMAPTMWLSAKIKSRREKIRRSLPDAVDLLVICVDAGLGLDQAVLRVCDELALSHPQLQDELSRVYLEQRAGKARLEAWDALAKRVKIAEITAFVSMLMQTDRFGTPIARALSGFAAELRLKRRQLAEEAAAKTKIKIIFPLVFCIFPCLFIVLLAPAILAIMRGLDGMQK